MSITLTPEHLEQIKTLALERENSYLRAEVEALKAQAAMRAASDHKQNVEKLVEQQREAQAKLNRFMESISREYILPEGKTLNDYAIDIVAGTATPKD